MAWSIFKLLDETDALITWHGLGMQVAAYPNHIGDLFGKRIALAGTAEVLAVHAGRRGKDHSFRTLLNALAIGDGSLDHRADANASANASVESVAPYSDTLAPLSGSNE